MIFRELEKILIDRIAKGKVVIISGPRQVGKTTLAMEIEKKVHLKTLWLNGDEPDIRDMLSNATSTRLQTIIGNNKLIIIDEAQRIQNIGITLKLIHDRIKNVHLLVTGSSSLELANEIKEPLTGRKFECFLYPVSFREMVSHNSFIEERRLLEHRMIFGYYPEVITNQGDEKNILLQLSDSYLYKDIFSLARIKKPMLLEKLLQALALQLGNEVRNYELGQLIGADNQTVERYINLLEKAFVIFSLPSISRNMRNEIKKGRKIYFYDNGIRNAIIKNFQPLTFRQDTGALWENYLISERKKNNEYSGRISNLFFWRTINQQEVDFIEERQGKLFAFEFKWSPQKKAGITKGFLKNYPDSEAEVITRDNYHDFLK